MPSSTKFAETEESTDWHTDGDVIAAHKEMAGEFVDSCDSEKIGILRAPIHGKATADALSDLWDGEHFRILADAFASPPIMPLDALVGSSGPPGCTNSPIRDGISSNWYAPMYSYNRLVRYLLIYKKFRSMMNCDSRIDLFARNIPSFFFYLLS